MCPIAVGATATFNSSGTIIVSATTSVCHAYSMVFLGTSIKVYGTIDISVNKTTVQYIINNEIISGNMTYTTPNTILFWQLLFWARDLAASNHTLSVTFANEIPSNFCLDYFKYTPFTLVDTAVTTTVATMAPTSTNYSYPNSEYCIVVINSIKEQLEVQYNYTCQKPSLIIFQILSDELLETETETERDRDRDRDRGRDRESTRALENEKKEDNRWRGLRVGSSFGLSWFSLTILDELSLPTSKKLVQLCPSEPEEIT
ncbi:hypothetical protein BDQ17DRAFT_1332022 [Cyathus striatus]|nr:hypothetical protein BDQ17DRAFT_1332022 [Cyathus striatus]